MNPDPVRKARIWLAVVFLVGAAIGGVFGYNFGHRSYAATVGPGQMSEAEWRAKRVAEMTKELGLSPDQSSKLNDVLRQKHQEMKSIRDKADQDVDAVRHNGRDQIRAFLTPEQLPKFETMVRHTDEERKKQQQAEGNKK
jgi:hypothetical protein